MALTSKPTECSVTSNAISTEYYNSAKWGRILILRGANYPAYATSCSMALLAADAWSIVQGTELQPLLDEESGVVTGKWAVEAHRVALKGFNERARRAVLIISSTVDQSLIKKIQPFAKALDPHGMWLQLKKLHRNTDREFNQAVVTKFHLEKWDPSEESIQEFSTRLEYYQMQLEGTECSIRDADLIGGLFRALPFDTIWESAETHCLSQNLEWLSCVAYLESREARRSANLTSNPPTAATANFVRGGRGGRGGRGRGRGGGGGAGGSNRGGITKSYKGKEKESKDDKKVDCFFCGKSGHFQIDCWRYQKAQKEAMKSKFGKKEKEEHPGIVVEEIQDQYNLCMASAANISASSMKQNWVIDSGATRHFTGLGITIESIANGLILYGRSGIYQASQAKGSVRNCLLIPPPNA